MIEFYFKQAIIFRSDLKIGKGKIAAQAGHAAVSAAEKARIHNKKWWHAWMHEGQCKIALKVKDKKELFECEQKAKELNLPYALIIDRGLTEVPPDTITCLGIGPGPAEKINEITGKLALL